MTVSVADPGGDLVVNAGLVKDVTAGGLTANTGGLSPAQYTLGIRTDFEAQGSIAPPTEQVTMTIDFAHAGGVSDVSFSIFDVDFQSGGSGWTDRLVFKADNGAIINPTSVVVGSAASFNGTDTVTGTANTGTTSNTGNVTVTFAATGITQVTVLYQSGQTADAAVQQINVHDINFNLLPVNTVPGAQSAFEQTQTSISGVSVNDVDGNLSTTRVSVGNGALNVTLAGGASISAGSNNSGDLTLSGTQAAINSTLASLKYTGGTNFVGTDTLTVLSTDTSGRTDSDTVSIAVANINDAPSGTNRAIAMPDNVRYTYSAADFGFSDASDTPANAMSGVYITTLPPVGTSLLLNGVAVTAGTTISIADINAGRFQYQADAGNRSWTFQVEDTGGVANGGVNRDQSANTITMNTSEGANAAPVLSNIALSMSVLEDAGVPSGAVGSPISSFTTGNITDGDANAQKGIAVTATNETNGTWYYSVNGGANWTAVGAVSSGSSLLLADNANTRLYFSPAADYNGTATGALTIRAWDQSSGVSGTKVSTATTGGATAFSAATDVIDVTVAPVNDAPVSVITATSYTATEQTSLSLVGGGLSVSDVDGPSVTATLSVGQGVLNLAAGTTGATVTNSGTATVTITGTQAQINNLLAGNSGATVAYLNSSDTPSASTTLTLTASDGTLSSSDTATINITAVNDAPVSVITAASYTATEQTSLSLVGGGLSVSDVDGPSVTATLSVGQGVLNLAAGTTGATVTNSGTATVTITGSQTQINDLLAGNGGATVAYLNSSDTPSASTTLTLTASDGTLSSSDTATINITAVNDAAVIGNPTVSAVTEDVGVSGGNLTASGSISVSDVDSAATFSTTVTGVGSPLGTLVLAANGSYTYTVSNAVTQSLGAGQTATDTFTVTSADGTTKNVSFTINGANDAAEISSPVVTLLETNAPLSTGGTLTISDVDGPTTFVAQTNVAGTNGVFSIDANGAWTYVASSALDSLNVGDSVSDTFTVAAADGTTSQVQVTIQGTNDAAVLSSAAVTLAETDAALSTSGTQSTVGTQSTGGAAQVPAVSTTTFIGGNPVTAALGEAAGAAGTSVQPVAGGSASASVPSLASSLGLPPVEAASVTGTPNAAVPPLAGFEQLNVLPATAAGPAGSVGGIGLVAGIDGDRGFPVARVAVDAGTPAVAAVLGPDTSERLFVYQGMQNASGVAGDSLQLAVPADAFGHTNPSAVVRLEASLADGSPLPGWIRFDNVSGAFSGTPPTAAAAEVEIKVVARDDAGRQAELVFRPVLVAGADTAAGVGFAASAPSAGMVGSVGVAAVPVTGLGGNAGAGAAFGGLNGSAGDLVAGSRAPGAGLDGGVPSASAEQGFPVARVLPESAERVAADGQRLFVFQGVATAESDSAEGYEFRIPRDAFAHTDPGAVVQLEARLADGSVLPAWLQFDAASGTLRGMPPDGQTVQLDLLVTARDEAGRTASVSFTSTIAAGNAPQAAGTGQLAQDMLDQKRLQGPGLQLDTAGSDGLGLKQLAAGQDRGFQVDGGLSAASLQLGVEATTTARGFELVRLDVGTAEAAASTIAADEGHRLFVFHGFSDVGVSGSASISFRVPPDAFAHTDPNATVLLEARLRDGSPLPAWLSFNAVTGQFSGTVPVGVGGVLQIEIVARDEEDRVARLEFSMDLEALVAEDAAAVAADGVQDLTLEMYEREGKESSKDGDREDRGSVAPGTAQPKGGDAVLEKRGASSFGEQLKAAKVARDPLLSRILTVPPGNQQGDRPA